MFDDGHSRINLRSEEIKDSLVPVLSDLLETVQKQFEDGKAKAEVIKHVQNHTAETEDYAVSAKLDVNVENFHSMPSQQRAVFQLYVDKAAEANKRASEHIQRSLYFESQSTAAETANKRLVQLFFNEMQPIIEEQLEIAAKREKTRIENFQKLQNHVKTVVEENQRLVKELSDKTNEIEQGKVVRHDLNDKLKELKRRLLDSERKGKEYSDSASSLKDDLKTAQKKNEELNSEVRSLKDANDKLTAENSRFKKDINRMKAEFDDEKKRYQDKVRKDHALEIQEVRQQAQEGLAIADKELKKSRSQTDYYYKEYQKMKQFADNAKEEAIRAVSRPLWTAIGQLDRKMTPLNGQYLKAPVHEPGLTARMRKAVDTSSSEMENIAPPPRPKVMKRSNSLAHTARHYTVRPQF